MCSFGSHDIKKNCSKLHYKKNLLLCFSVCLKRALLVTQLVCINAQELLFKSEIQLKSL